MTYATTRLTLLLPQMQLFPSKRYAVCQGNSGISFLPSTHKPSNVAMLREKEQPNLIGDTPQKVPLVSYTPQEAARFAGAYLTHEVGHLLFHFGHPFGRTRCVMNPSTLLIFRGWYDATYAGNCAFESHPQMTPGAFRFLYKRYQTDSDR